MRLNVNLRFNTWRFAASLLVLLLFGTTGCNRAPGARELIQQESARELVAGQPVCFRLGSLPEQPILVEARGYETEFVTRLEVAGECAESSGSDMIQSVSTPYLRTPPQFLLLDPAASPGPLQISVLPVQATRNASVDLRVYVLPGQGSADAKAIEAFRAYAEGTRTVSTDDAAVFREKVDHLLHAAKGFRDVEDYESALWAESNAAFFQYWPILDFPAALLLTNKIEAQAEDQGLVRLSLHSLIRRGEILTEICAGNPFESLFEARVAALDAYRAAEHLADSEAEAFEQAWAINAQGITEYYLGRYQSALTHYERALALVRSFEDSWFESQIEGSQSMIREIRGVEDMALVLEDWEARVAELADTGASSEREHALIELGRVYQQLSLYPRSIEALSAAIEIAKHRGDLFSESRARLWLASAYQAMGEFNRAENLLLEALPQLESANNCRRLKDVHRLLANLARQRNAFETAALHREQERKYVASDLDLASYHFSRGVDVAAAGEAHDQQALDSFRSAVSVLKAQENPGVQLRAELRYCQEVQQHGASDPLCAPGRTEALYEQLMSLAGPRIQIEAMQIQAELLLARGEQDRAVELLRTLVERVEHYRSTLPGVLGSWYWESLSPALLRYPELEISRDLESGGGIRSLVALNSLRDVGLAKTVQKLPSATDVRLRSLYFQLEQATDTPAADSIRDQIVVELARTVVADSRRARIDESWLHEVLGRWPADMATLVLHVTEHGSWAWYLSQSGLELMPLESSGRAWELIARVKANMRTHGDRRLEADLDLLGETLLAGIAGRLPARLFVQAGGPLNGFPVDLLRINGGYLAEFSHVANLQSLTALSSLVTEGEDMLQFKSVLLAGASAWDGTGLLQIPQVEAELDIVSKSFPDAELEWAMGRDFNRSVALGPGMENADLVHIASHAEVNLEYPELSRLYLGDAQSDADYLTPFAMLGLQMQARLVVLSACETTGSNEFSHDSNLGFVSTMLGAGASQVLATLWPVADAESLGFMRRFYNFLGDGDPPVVALGKTKRAMLDGDDSAAIEQVLAYQLYVR